MTTSSSSASRVFLALVLLLIAGVAFIANAVELQEELKAEILRTMDQGGAEAADMAASAERHGLRLRSADGSKWCWAWECGCRGANGNVGNSCDAFCNCHNGNYCNPSFHCSCGSTANCPAGQKCVAIGFWDGYGCRGCGTSSDCGSGKYCINNSCVTPAAGSACTQDYMCPSGYVCNSGTNTCRTPQGQGAVCGKRSDCISTLNCCQGIFGTLGPKTCGCCPGQNIGGTIAGGC